MNEINQMKFKLILRGLTYQDYPHIERIMDKVYAGGDIVLGAATVILAMGEGRNAAAAINRMLRGEPDPVAEPVEDKSGQYEA